MKTVEELAVRGRLALLGRQMTFDSVCRDLDLIPRGSGLYAWYVTTPELGRSMRPGLPDIPVDRPVYIGKGRSIRTRMEKNHRRLTSASALRRTLSGILAPRLELTTRLAANGNFRLAAHQDGVYGPLTTWMRSNLAVVCFEIPAEDLGTWQTPKELDKKLEGIEKLVIGSLLPPLNHAHMPESETKVWLAEQKAHLHCLASRSGPSTQGQSARTRGDFP